MEAAASHARPPAGFDTEAGTYLTGGVRWIRSGGATLFAGTSAGWSLDEARGDWVSGFAGADWSEAVGTSGTRAGFGVVGTGFRVAEPDRYTALLLRARPSLSAPLGGVRWVVRGVAGVGRREVGVERRDGPGPPARTTASDEVWEAGGGLAAGRWLGPVEVEVSGEVRKTGEGTWRTSGLALEWGGAWGDLRADVAWWDGPLESAGSARVGVSLPLGGGVRLEGAGGTSAPDPLLGTPSAGYASTAVSVDLVRLLHAPNPPVVAYPEGTPGRVRFRVVREGAGAVEVLGDFSTWEPVEMRHEGAGVWVVEVEVPPGVHHFGFRVDGEWWVPEGAPGRTVDEWGRSTATLVVPDA